MEQRFRRPTFVVADGEARFVRLRPHEARIGHAEWAKDRVSQEVGKRDSAQLLDYLLEVRETLAGVAPPGPRRPPQTQRTARRMHAVIGSLPPVGKTSRV